MPFRVLSARRPPLDELTPQNLHAYRAKLVKDRAPSTANLHIAGIKAMLNYGLDFGLIERVPNLRKALAKIPVKLVRRFADAKRRANGGRTFDPGDLRRIIAMASPPLHAMILLGINCGFGNTDCSELCKTDIDLKRQVIDYHLFKTGIKRTAPLWRETVVALKKVLAESRPTVINMQDSEWVFITRFGRPWIRVITTDSADEGAIVKKNDEVAKQFNKLLRKLKLDRPGLGFYSLRHTFRTWADEVHDQHAIHRIMGHAIPGMSGIYVEEIGMERLRRVVNHVRRKLWPGANGEKVPSDRTGNSSSDEVNPGS